MVFLRTLAFIFIIFPTQMRLLMSYETGSLCMYQAMTFYETYGLEVAHKILKKRLAAKVYIITNMTQSWHDKEVIQYHDQIFLLMIGRRTKMYNLFQKLEEVNFQTGFELIAEEITDGNAPYLDWASRYVPSYDVGNETTLPEHLLLRDTEEANEFRENFLNKKYGTTPNQTTVTESTDPLPNDSFNQDPNSLKTRGNIYKRVKKDDQVTPEYVEAEENNDQAQNMNQYEEEEEEKEEEGEEDENYEEEENEYDIRERLQAERQQELQDYREFLKFRNNRYYDRIVNRPLYRKRISVARGQQNAYRNIQRVPQNRKTKTTRSRSIMDVIKSIISPKSSNQQAQINKARPARRGRKVRRRMRARKINDDYPPYKFVHEMVNNDEMENIKRSNAMNNVIYVKHINNNNNAQEQRQRSNVRRTARARKFRAKNRITRVTRGRKPAYVKNTKAYKMGNAYKRREMNRVPEEDFMYHHQNIHKPNPITAHFGPVNDAIYGNKPNEMDMQNYHVYRIPNLGYQPPKRARQKYNKYNARFIIRPYEEHRKFNFHPSIAANGYHPYPVRPVYNPNNLPILHETANRQKYAIHDGQVMNERDIVKMPKARCAQAKQPRKTKNAPRARKAKTGVRASAKKSPVSRSRPARARKAKVQASTPQYFTDVQQYHTVHFVNIMPQHYQPQKRVLMIQ